MEIQECEIVATHLGPRSNRISFYVTRLKALGCEGLTTHGAPRPSHSRQEINDARERLESYRQQSRLSCSVSAAPSSFPSNSAQASQAPHEEPLTQSRYVTQPSRPRKRKERVSSGLTPEESQPKGLDIEKTYSALPGVRPDTPSSSKHSVALRFENLPLQPETHQVPLFGTKRPTIAGDRREIDHTESLLKLLCANPAPIPPNGERLGSPAREQDDHDPLPSAHPQHEQESSRKRTDKDGAVRSQNLDVDEKIHPSSPPDGSIAAIQSSPPNKIRKKRHQIGFREIMIPKMQRKLLESPSCWLPPEPGQRGPITNVPMSLLQTFNDEANASRKNLDRSDASRAASCGQNTKARELFQPTEHEESEHETPESVDSSEWPESSPIEEDRNLEVQLPPDSSAPRSPEAAHVVDPGSRAVLSTSIHEEVESCRSPYHLDSSPRHRNDDNSRGGQADRSIVVSSNTEVHVPSAHGPAKNEQSEGMATSRRLSPSIASQQNHIPQAFEHILDTAFSQQHNAGRSPEHRNEEMLQGHVIHEPESPDVETKKLQNDQGPPEPNGFYPSQESDLETMIPTAMKSQLPPHSVDSMWTSTDSSKSLKSQATLQVKRTPYVTSTAQEISKADGVSPTKVKIHDIDLTNSSWPSQTSNLTVNTTHGAPHHVVQDCKENEQQSDRPGRQATTPAVTAEILGGTESEPWRPEAPQPGSAQYELQTLRNSPRITQWQQPTVEGSWPEEKADNTPVPVLGIENIQNGAQEVTSQSQDLHHHVNGELTSHQPLVYESSDQHPSTPVSPASWHHPDNWSLDRRGSGSVASTPRSAKKRKIFQFPPFLNHDQNSQQLDPRAVAKNARREFFEARKQSLTSENTSAATSPQATPKQPSYGHPSLAEEEPHLLREPMSADGALEPSKRAEGTLDEDADHGLTLNTQDFERGLNGSTENISPQACVGAGSVVPSEDTRQSSRMKDNSREQQILRIENTDQRGSENPETRIQLDDNGALHSRATFPAPKSPHSDVHSEPPAEAMAVGKHDDLDIQTAQIGSPPKAGLQELQRQMQLDTPDISPPPVITTIYDRFKATYPTFTGTMDYFIAICTRIKALADADKMEHKSLWDDFVIRHKLNFPQYLLQCAELAQTPLSYEQFYRSEIDEPAYTKRVITPKTLPEALALKKASSTSDTYSDRSPGARPGAAESPYQGDLLTKAKSHTQPAVSRNSSTSRRISATPQQLFSPEKIVKDPQNRSALSPQTQRSQPAEPLSSPLTVDLTISDSEEDRRNAQAAGPPSPISKRSPLSKRLERRRSKRAGSQELLPELAASPIPTSRRDSKHACGTTPKVTSKTGKDVFGAFGAIRSGKDVIAKEKQPEEVRELKPSATSRAQKGSTRSAFDPGHNLSDLHRDPDSPFNQFFRRYFEIRPGNSNSYAADDKLQYNKEKKSKGGKGGKERESRRSKDGESEQRGGGGSGGTRRIDFMKWELL